ncbi:MAG: phenylalanine--tRNA ligase subunit beta [Planctomycetaceae bacterium]|nr:phenylalanine--tRNA ligase subunit beta [Planctomycetaceae bacterium]
MYISLDWISDYVDLTGLDVPTITNRLTLATAEVEGTKTIQRFVKGVLIGEIKTVETLTDKLSFCTVDCGKKTYTTVCGAPNVRVGLKAPFAPAGTLLAGNLKVEAVEMSGKPSQGILCSAAELGMSDWHEILLECPDSVPVGTPLEELIPETDTLIEIDNKSLTHRPDLWGHYGFAREFAAIFGRELKPLPQIDLSAFDSLPAYPLVNEDYENCPCYGCIEFETKREQTRGTIPSPLYVQRRLHALGIRSYNLLVDVTNYVNWEIAQPTHAFDAEKLGGVRIATLGEKESEVRRQETEFTTLDAQPRKLLPEDLLIWGSAQNEHKSGGRKPAGDDAYRPVALAGIMGGLETEVTESTVKILLESANFKASRVRRTAGRLDLRTDASQRFEKSQPPSNVKVGIARILKLIEDSGADLKVLSRFTVDGDLQEEMRYIDIPVGRLEQLAGIQLPPEKVTQILESLGFVVQRQKGETFTIGVPPFRSRRDISIPEDILEEVLRVYGFDNIPPVMPTVPVTPLHVEKPLKMGHKIRRVLAMAHRFLEVHNYIWYNDNWLKTLDYEPGETLVLKNPTTPETSRLRTTLIPNLLALVPKNRPFRKVFRLFEVGRTFFSVQKNKECLEKHHLGGVAYQHAGSWEEFYLSVKSAVEGVLATCGVQNITFTEPQSSDCAKRAGDCVAGIPVWRSPENFVKIYSNGEPIGTLGILDKALTTKVCREGGQIVWFEIDLDAVAGTLYPEAKFEEPPEYPLSWQDFSLLWKVADGFDKLESLLDRFSNPLVIRREFLVSHRGKDLDKETACYSFRFWIGSPDHTLSGEEIETFHQQFLAYIKENNVALRT